MLGILHVCVYQIKHVKNFNFEIDISWNVIICTKYEYVKMKKSYNLKFEIRYVRLNFEIKYVYVKMEKSYNINSLITVLYFNNR